MPNDLAQWLREQLADDEQTARAAHQPNWLTDGRRGLRYGLDDEWMADALTTADADHIARHDPARVLREIDAKRRIIDLCEPPLVEVTGLRDSEPQYLPGAGAPWGEDVLRLLALPYADRPGYRDEWRP